MLQVRHVATVFRLSALAEMLPVLEPEPDQAELWRAFDRRCKEAKRREVSVALRRVAAIKREVAAMNDELDALGDFIRLVALVAQREEAVRRRQWDLIEELCQLQERLER